MCLLSLHDTASDLFTTLLWKLTLFTFHFSWICLSLKIKSTFWRERRGPSIKLENSNFYFNEPFPDMHFPFMRYKCCCMSRSRKTYAQYKCICIRIQFCSVATPSLEYRKNLERVFVSVFNDMESIYELCELFPSQIEGEVKCCIHASVDWKLVPLTRRSILGSDGLMRKSWLLRNC